jgi:hypothetical protein
MKIVCSLMLTALSAIAGDSEEVSRERLSLCNQLLIEEPGIPTIPGWSVGLGWGGPQPSRMCQQLRAER